MEYTHSVASPRLGAWACGALAGRVRCAGHEMWGMVRLGWGSASAPGASVLHEPGPELQRALGLRLQLPQPRPGCSRLSSPDIFKQSQYFYYIWTLDNFSNRKTYQPTLR